MTDYLFERSEARTGIIPQIAFKLWSFWRTGLLEENKKALVSMTAYQSLIVKMLLYGPLRDSNKDQGEMYAILALKAALDKEPDQKVIE